jgi:hypothetical protein
MVQIPVEQLAKSADPVRLVEMIRTKRILLTLEGKPFALIQNIEHFGDNYDAEDFDYMTDPEFWRMIRQRRKERGGIPLEQIEAELGMGQRPHGRKGAGAAAAHKGR